MRRGSFWSGVILSTVTVMVSCDVKASKVPVEGRSVGAFPVTVRGNTFPEGEGFLDSSLPLRDVVIEKRPERVVVVGPPLYVEILEGIGALDRVVGIAKSPNNPRAAQSIPTVGTSMQWSIERVLSLEPDLVFGASRWGQRLERDFGLTVLTAGRPGGNIEDIDDILATIQTVDLAVHGNSKRSDSIVSKMRADVADVSRRARDKRRPAVAVVYAPPQYDPTIAGSGTPEHQMIEMAGGRNAFGDASGYKTMNLESLLLLDPEFIVTDSEQVARLESDTRLVTLRAIRESKVIPVRAARIVSVHVVDELRTIAERLHPEEAGGR